MQQTRIRRSAVYWIAAAALLAACILLWPALSALLTQFAAAYLLMALALPICRLLERFLKPSLAAAVSFFMLGGAVAAVVLLALPPVLQQAKQLIAALPQLLENLQGWLIQLQEWLQQRGIDMTPVRAELFATLSARAGEAVSAIAGSVARAVQSSGKLLLAPLFAFYLLRDRRIICTRLLLLAPVHWRTRLVRAAREMKRETLGYLRGQLLLSLSIGALTALGLLATGTPGWLALGLLMGVMELIPYIGPLIAGVPAVLLALQGGILRGAWTLGVLLLVQQAEGNVLSPRLLSNATQLHPLAVLAAISAGGLIAGTLGMLLAIPVVVSVRGAVRGLRV